MCLGTETVTHTGVCVRVWYKSGDQRYDKKWLIFTDVKHMLITGTWRGSARPVTRKTDGLVWSTCPGIRQAVSQAGCGPGALTATISLRGYGAPVRTSPAETASLPHCRCLLFSPRSQHWCSRLSECTWVFGDFFLHTLTHISTHTQLGGIHSYRDTLI